MFALRQAVHTGEEKPLVLLRLLCGGCPAREHLSQSKTWRSSPDPWWCLAHHGWATTTDLAWQFHQQAVGYQRRSMTKIPSAVDPMAHIGVKSSAVQMVDFHEKILSNIAHQINQWPLILYPHSHYHKP